MKIIAVLATCLVFVLAEPPVPSRQYLPISVSQYNTIPSSAVYSVPTYSSSDITFAPVQQYGVPNIQTNIQTGIPKPQYGLSSNTIQLSKSQYGVPRISSSSAIFGNSLAVASKPDVQYDVPQVSTNYFAHSPIPTHQYSSPASGSIGTISVSKLDAQYGVPQISSNLLTQSPEETHQYSSPAPVSEYGIPVVSSSYLASNSGYSTSGAAEKYETNSEPANYDYKYYVQDVEHGNDFGHEEGRQGDVATGRYSVLLADGRRQTVEYIADAGGYRPKISYEQVGNGYTSGGYSGHEVQHGDDQGGYRY